MIAAPSGTCGQSPSRNASLFKYEMFGEYFYSVPTGGNSYWAQIRLCRRIGGTLEIGLTELEFKGLIITASKNRVYVTIKRVKTIITCNCLTLTSLCTTNNIVFVNMAFYGSILDQSQNGLKSYIPYCIDWN